MTLLYNVVRRDNSVDVTVFLDGTMLVADENHPNIDDILEAVVNGETDGLLDLFDPSVRAQQEFESLSDMISVSSGLVYVDGDPIDDVYADQIVRFMKEGLPFDSLVKFLQKVYTNTEAHTRENLSRWLMATGGFTIDSEGDIRGYKGVRSDMRSIRSGPGVVNGVAMIGNLDNSVGNVVSIPRSKVEHNPAVGCSSGLHVGTWSYASGFAQGAIVEVKVNPRDIVSVPTDCGDQKMRVARYRVMRAVSVPYESPLADYDDDEWDDPDEYDYY